MLTFFWHGVSMLVAKEHPKHTLVVYAALTFFTIVVMALYKWDKKWMRIKTSIGMLVFGVSLLIYLFCWFAYLFGLHGLQWLCSNRNPSVCLRAADRWFDWIHKPIVFDGVA